MVVGTGPAGLQTSYSLSRCGIGNHALLSADDAPGGMFRRFPIFERLISWTKPDAPFERETREYECYDNNSLVADEPEASGLIAEFMDRSFDVPARGEMEAALAAFAERAGIQARYGCRWTGTRQEEGGFVLETTDGEYRCPIVVFAIGMTEPWSPPLEGSEHATHYVETGSAESYRGKRVVIIGKRNSGFELASGLLPWARELTLVSPRTVDISVLAKSPLRARYLQPYEEYVRGSAGAYVLDGSIVGIERGADGVRVTADATTWDGRLSFTGDEVILATGFRAPIGDLRKLGVVTVINDRVPALTPVLGERVRAGDLLRREHHDRLSRAPEGRCRGELQLGERVPLQRARSRPVHRRAARDRAAAADARGGRRRPAISSTSWRAGPSSGSRRATSRASWRGLRTGSATRGSCRSSTSWTAAAAGRTRRPSQSR